MAVTSDSNLIGLYKTTYSEKTPEDTFFRNSPTAKKAIEKIERVGGKEYRIPILAGNIANASGNAQYTQTKAGTYGSSPNLEFVVTPGQIFSGYFITKQEEAYSEEKQWSYTRAGVNKFGQMLDSFRKLLATSLFGSGFGELGQIALAQTVASGSNTFTFPQDVVTKLSIGSDFRFTNGATPGSNLRTSVNTVTKIDGVSVTFTATAADGLLAATDWICFEGCRSGSATPLLPIGLSGWVPSIANRSGGTWTTYIGTTFYTVDRSVNVNGLAGQFIRKGYPAPTYTGENTSASILRLVQMLRTAGAVPDFIIVNPTVWYQIGVETTAQLNFMQQINTSPQKGQTNSIVNGFENYKYSFATSFLEYIVDDPFCPATLAYAGEMEMLSMTTPVNVKTPGMDGIKGNDPGKTPYPDDVKSPAEDYTWWIDEYINIQPASSMAVNGSSKYVNIEFWGNWVLYNPSKWGVVSLT